MVLGFKSKFPDGKPTYFVSLIHAGLKIHTMRVGHRWKPSMSIQMATGVRTKHYHQFNALPQQADLQMCTSTQTFWFRVSGEAPYEELHLEILMDKAKVYSTPTQCEIRSGIYGFWESQVASPAFPDSNPNRDLQEFAQNLAKNDGFDSIKALFDWFRPLVLSQPGQPWERRLSGQIIHWTDFRY